MRVTKPMIERGAGPLQDALGLHAVEARGLASRVLHAAHDEPLETDQTREIPGQTTVFDFMPPTAELPLSPDATLRGHG